MANIEKRDSRRDREVLVFVEDLVVMGGIEPPT
jgi:hypothetical protein